MKITDPDVIKNGEKDLIDAVKDDLDLDIIKQILEKKIAATALSSKGGEIVVHNNKIAFRLDFDLNLSGSLMFDREGNYISETDEDQDMHDMASQALDSQFSNSDDIDSVNIHLDEIEETVPDVMENDQDFDIDLDGDLKIGLPDYDLDEEDEEGSEDATLDKIEDDDIDEVPDSLDSGPLDAGDIGLDDIDQLTDELDIEGNRLYDATLEDKAMEEDIITDDLVDDDINDILKESQDFWDKKKDS